MSSENRVESFASGHTLTPGNAQVVIRRAWESGRIHITGHFRKRAEERKFTTVNAGQVIIRGTVLASPPEYCLTHGNWKYQIVGRVDNQKLMIVVGLSFEEDCMESPLIVLITGCWDAR